MSGAVESRAAVFTSSPQSVEVYQAGTWWRGELLGWRHDASGTCQMWVRVVVGGVEETAWIDLSALRLPETQADPATAPGRIDARVKQELPPAQAISALRGRPLAADTTVTAALPMIRDEVVAPATVAAAAAVPTVAPTVSVPRPGGRRRAREESDVRSLAAAEVAVPPGRHRAPRGEGRHRTADTDVLAPVAGEVHRSAGSDTGSTAAGESRRAARLHAGAGRPTSHARAARSEEFPGRPEVCTGRVEVEADLLTRPMRLGNLSPSTRRPAVGGSLSGV